MNLVEAGFVDQPEDWRLNSVNIVSTPKAQSRQPICERKQSLQNYIPRSRASRVCQPRVRQSQLMSTFHNTVIKGTLPKKATEVYRTNQNPYFSFLKTKS